MAKGIKTGGRQKGTPNRTTTKLLRQIADTYPDFNPIFELIEISKQEKLELSKRIIILKEIASYMYPKIKPREEIKENNFDIFDISG